MVLALVITISLAMIIALTTVSVIDRNRIGVVSGVGRLVIKIAMVIAMTSVMVVIMAYFSTIWYVRACNTYPVACCPHNACIWIFWFVIVKTDMNILNSYVT